MICFFDTNVLVYAVDPRNVQKQQAALDLCAKAISDGSFTISAQVLNEFYRVTTRANQALLNHEQACTQISALARQRVVPVTANITLAALARLGISQISWWDSLILEAAISAGASTLYTEDLQHRQHFGELTVVNPFMS